MQHLTKLANINILASISIRRKFPLPLFLWFLICFYGTILKAQHEFMPLSNDFHRLFENYLHQEHTDFHTSVKPYRRSEVANVVNYDSVMAPLNFYNGSSWFMRKAFQEHFFVVKTDDFSLRVDPIVDFRLGVDDHNGNRKRTFTNVRGVWVTSEIGRQVTFQTGFAESQARFPTYVNAWIDSTGVVPGNGIRRPFRDVDHDYQYAFGSVSYTPSKYFNFSLGQDRNFFGEGHRSVFLSDNTFSYPFFKIESTFWKVKYVNLWTQMYDPRQSVILNNSFRKKWMSAHYLSWNITKKLGVQVYEAVIIGGDSNNQGWDISFMNPVILYRPIEYASRSRGKKVVLGGGLTYKVFEGATLYSQFLLDEFVFSEFTGEPGSWRNKYSWQLGGKYYKRAGNHRFFGLLEWNGVRPYTYSHNFPESNYTHFMESLAHPWGANFKELLLNINYGWKRFTADIHMSSGIIGLDANGNNWGNNLFLNYNTGNGANRFDNFIGQGVGMDYFFLDLRLGYILNPATNLRLEGGVTLRNMLNQAAGNTGIPDSKTQFVYFGMRTAIFNNYFDF
jgi:hypothetical protein